MDKALGRLETSMRLLLVASFAALALVLLPGTHAEPAVAPCTGPNEAVLHDVMDTLADPTHPECGSLTQPCFTQGWSCYGCGPDIIEWIVGPIYCV